MSDDGVSVTLHTIAEHTYNGLSWRIRSNFDTSSPFDGTFEQNRIMYYNAAWQLIQEEDEGPTGSSSDDRVLFHLSADVQIVCCSVDVTHER